MSAQENKRLMESIFAGVAVGDRAALVDALADDVTMRVTGQYSWSRTSSSPNCQEVCHGVN